MSTIENGENNAARSMGSSDSMPPHGVTGPFDRVAAPNILIKGGAFAISGGITGFLMAGEIVLALGVFFALLIGLVVGWRCRKWLVGCA